MASTMHSILRRVRPDLLDLLGVPTQATLEPFAFAYFATKRPGVTLDQLCIGYVPQAQRPALTRVATDGRGRAYLPVVGYLGGLRPNAIVDLPLGLSAPNVVSAPLQVGACGVELLRHDVPVLDEAFKSADPLKGDPDHRVISRGYLAPLRTALTILEEIAPDVSDMLSSCVRRAVVFESIALNSFATPAVYGAVFLNATLGSSAVCLLEDFVHQGGHVLFGSVTSDGHEYFRGATKTSMSELNGHAADGRSVYEALHGVFTLGLIAEVLDKALEAGRPGIDRVELQGRLAFALMRSAVDLKSFGMSDLLTDRGAEFVHDLAHQWRIVVSRRAETVRAINLSNQTYNFSYERLLAVNPRHVFAS